MNAFMLVLFVLVVTALFAVGFYLLQKRFWPQNKNHSRTAPTSPTQGTGNELGDNDPVWRPPKAE